MSKMKREKLVSRILSQLPPNATEAEKVVFLEKSLYEYVTLVVSNEPFTDATIDEISPNIIDSDTSIRKRTVETVMASYARRYPNSHIALFSTSEESDGRPIYIYN